MKDYRNIPITRDEYFDFMKDYFKENPPDETREQLALTRLRKYFTENFPDRDSQELENAVASLKDKGLPYIIQWYYYELFLVIGKKTRHDFDTFKSFSRYFEFMDILYHLEQISGRDWSEFPMHLMRFFMAIRRERKMST